MVYGSDGDTFGAFDNVVCCDTCAIGSSPLSYRIKINKGARSFLLGPSQGISPVNLVIWNL